MQKNGWEGRTQWDDTEKSVGLFQYYISSTASMQDYPRWNFRTTYRGQEPSWNMVVVPARQPM
jgi:hypothetical protein